MKRISAALCSATLVLSVIGTPASAQPPERSTFLANVSWLQAQKLLTEDAVVVIAIGNASKAHGPHLPLSTDFIHAEYVKDRIAKRTAVVVVPSVATASIRHSSSMPVPPHCL